MQVDRNVDPGSAAALLAAEEEEPQHEADRKGRECHHLQGEAGAGGEHVQAVVLQAADESSIQVAVGGATTAGGGC